MDTLAVPAATTQRASPPNPPRGRPLPGIAVTFLFVHWFRPFHAPGPSPAPKQVSSYKFDLASATQIDMIFLVVVALPVQRNLQMVLFTLVLYVQRRLQVLFLILALHIQTRPMSVVFLDVVQP